MRTVSIAAGVLFALAACGALAPRAFAEEEIDESTIDAASIAAEGETLEHVPKILKIVAVVEESDPPTLVVTAYGQVPTGGWKQVQLVRRVYVTPPADGIWEYDLLALKPGGIVTQVLTTVKASNKWKDYDTNIKGVRVYGIGRGVKEVKVP